MSLFAFLGGAFIATAGIIAHDLDGTWQVLEWGIIILLMLLILLAPRR